MSKGVSWRVLLILLFLIMSSVYLTPTLVTTLPSWWKGVFPTDKIHLGLDLQGGAIWLWRWTRSRRWKGRSI